MLNFKNKLHNCVIPSEAKPSRGILGRNTHSRRLPFALALTLITLTLAAIATVVIYRTPNTNAIAGKHQAGAGPKSHAGFPFRQPAAITNGLVGWWKMDGNANDSSATANNGTANLATLATGKFGKVYTFSGASGSYVAIPKNAALNINGDITLSAWVNMAARNTYGSPIIDKNNGTGGGQTDYLFRVSSAGVLYLYAGNGTTDYSTYSVAVIPLNEWHFVTATISSTTMTVYVDGMASGTPTTFVGTRNNSNHNLGVGSRMNSDNYYTGGSLYNFNGSVDDVRVYNRALSPEEITTLYQGSAPPACDQTCLAWWKLDETGTTGTADDSSGHGYTGTLTNFLFDSNDGWRGGAIYNGGLFFYRSRADYVSIADDAAFDATATPLTVTGWVKRTNVYAYAIIVKGRQSIVPSGGWKIRFSNSNDPTTLGFLSNKSNATTAATLTTTSTVPLNTWVHFAFVFKIDTATLGNNTAVAYINGRQDPATIVRTGLPVTYAAGVTIGTEVGGSGDTFSGYMDDVRVYNRALEPYEIYNLYAAGR